ncbi:hypothetical protein CB1_000533004 [Camelus ferus]|nr:hypothetical protein CB1_000533004 [Camelus ferus]
MVVCRERERGKHACNVVGEDEALNRKSERRKKHPLPQENSGKASRRRPRKFSPRSRSPRLFAPATPTPARARARRHELPLRGREHAAALVVLNAASRAGFGGGAVEESAEAAKMALRDSSVNLFSAIKWHLRLNRTPDTDMAETLDPKAKPEVEERRQGREMPSSTGAFVERPEYATPKTEPPKGVLSQLAWGQYYNWTQAQLRGLRLQKEPEALTFHLSPHSSSQKQAGGGQSPKQHHLGGGLPAPGRRAPPAGCGFGPS